jgi:hypothetical protein
LENGGKITERRVCLIKVLANETRRLKGLCCLGMAIGSSQRVGELGESTGVLV